VHFGDDAAARSLALRANEYLADLKRDRPDRFGAFATLPLPDVEGSLEQIAYAFDVLELDGVSRSVAGLGNVVFGTDYPYPRDAISIAGLRQLQQTAELDDSERRGVLGASAARLIPRLAGVGSATRP
jgi:predicted TIM-barrel fold metal-dependent hydrolase